MPPILDPAERLFELLDQLEPSMARQFVASIAQLRDQESVVEIARAIASGNDTDAVFRVAEGAAQRVQEISQAAFYRAGEATAHFIGTRVGAFFDFDRQNDIAAAFVRMSGAARVREFTFEQVQATRAALAEGTRRGLNPRAQARMFRDSIGLTERQQQAVINYRRLLETRDAAALQRKLRDRRFDPSVRAALEGRRTLSAQQIDTMVGRYRERFVRYRSEVIARSESLRAVHEGSREAYRQAEADGMVTNIRRTWIPANDDRVRDSHADMRDQERGMDEPFESGRGNFLMYPGDPAAPPEDTVQCRCATTTRSGTAERSGRGTREDESEDPGEVGRTRSLNVGGVRYSRERREGESLVVLDSRKVDRAWSRDKGFYIPRGGGGAEIGGRRARFREFLASETAPVRASQISLSPVDGPPQVGFTDGRHRFSVLRDDGQARAAFYVPNEQRDRFLELFSPDQ